MPIQVRNLGTLYTGQVLAPDGTIRIRPSPTNPSELIMTVVGSGGGGAPAAHASTHEDAGSDPLAGEFTGITRVGTLDELNVSGVVRIGTTTDLGMGFDPTILIYNPDSAEALSEATLIANADAAVPPVAQFMFGWRNDATGVVQRRYAFGGFADDPDGGGSRFFFLDNVLAEYLLVADENGNVGIGNFLGSIPGKLSLPTHTTAVGGFWLGTDVTLHRSAANEANVVATAGLKVNGTLVSLAGHAHSAADLTSGTIPDARFPATLPAVSGANLTNLDASDLASGTVPLARLSGITNAEIAAAAAIAWTKLSKTGSSLADLATRSASDLSSGTVPDARFPATLPAASGANLTALNATQLTSGAVPAARLTALPVPTQWISGSANTTDAVTWVTLATLTIPTTSSAGIEARIQGRSTASATAAGYHVRACSIRTTGLGAASIMAQAAIADCMGAGLVGAAFQFVVSGATVSIQAKGLAATTIAWTATLVSTIERT